MRECKSKECNNAPDSGFSLTDAQKVLREFTRERDWERYHTPKNIAMALAGEAGELIEIFQWLGEDQSWQVMDDQKTGERVRHELADVFIYVLRLADLLNIDLGAAFSEKLAHNAAKYPVHLAKGNAKKYTDF